MAIEQRKITDTREVAAFLIAGMVQLGFSFSLVPRIYQQIADAGYSDALRWLGFIVGAVELLALLALFLFVRWVLEGLAAGAPPPEGLSGESSRGRKFGFASIVLGALGLVPGLGLAFAIAGLSTGLMERHLAIRAGDPHGASLGLAGIVVSTITLLIEIAIWGVVAYMLIFGFDAR